MAKRQGYEKGAEIRAKRIQNCLTCKGAPNCKTTNLQGIITTYCDDCMEVVDYKQEGSPDITNKKVSEVAKLETNDRVDKSVESKIFPIGYSFSSLMKRDIPKM